MRRKAWVIGATGLVGTELVKQLINSDQFEEIHVFVRAPLERISPKIQIHLTDFQNPEIAMEHLSGDVLFSALGTTLKTAGSKEKQFQIDYKFVYQFAEKSAERGVKSMINVSSIGANEKSSNFYLNMKGKLEQALNQLPFEHVIHLRPSMLDGERKEFRLGEKISLPIMRLLSRIPAFKKWGVIQAKQVAHAAIHADSIEKSNRTIWEMDQLLR